MTGEHANTSELVYESLSIMSVCNLNVRIRDDDERVGCVVDGVDVEDEG